MIKETREEEREAGLYDRAGSEMHLASDKSQDK